MPLPIGHTAIGLATFELNTNNNSTLYSLKIIIFLTILANLPDFDVIVGLLLKCNGNAFHRGPTHSLIFALIMGFFASRAWKFSSQIPRMKFEICFFIILSHILTDFLFTSYPVSFFWPFEISWISGLNGCGEVLTSMFFQGSLDFGIIIGDWGEVLTSLFSQGSQDLGIIIGSAISIISIRLIRKYKKQNLTFYRDSFQRSK